MKKYLLIIAMITITVLAAKAAYITRGYFAVGGEWLIWVFPVLIQVATKTSKNKKGEENIIGNGNTR